MSENCVKWYNDTDRPDGDGVDPTEAKGSSHKTGEIEEWPTI